MILDPPLPTKLLRPIDDSRHRRRVERIVDVFSVAFSDIRYDVYWQSRVANAQAFLWAGERCVRLYGGLARHRGLTVAGIAWVLAHETGHHLGGPPYHELQPALSSEAASTAWAIDHGLKRAFGPALAKRYVVIGCRELSQYSLTKKIY
jgi:Zn-dependent protease with chaperone function